MRDDKTNLEPRKMEDYERKTLEKAIHERMMKHERKVSYFGDNTLAVLILMRHVLYLEQRANKTELTS